MDANYTATYSAFCRQYGYHSTGAVGLHNWNEEAIEGMVQDLSGPWQGLCSVLVRRNERTVLLIEDLMDWAIQYLGKPCTSYSVKKRPVLDGFLTVLKILSYKKSIRI